MVQNEMMRCNLAGNCIHSEDGQMNRKQQHNSHNEDLSTSPYARTGHASEPVSDTADTDGTVTV